MPVTLDRTDKALLNALQGNARLTVAELAERAQVKVQSLTLSMNRLEELGLITRRADPEDRRRQLVELTEAAAKVLGSLGDLHDRLPVPLDAETMDAWLTPGRLGSAEEADALVGQVCAGAYDVAAGWVLRPVGTAVGTSATTAPS